MAVGNLTLVQQVKHPPGVPAEKHSPGAFAKPGKKVNIPSVDWDEPLDEAGFHK